jgi:hypothetical protein
MPRDRLGMSFKSRPPRWGGNRQFSIDIEAVCMVSSHAPAQCAAHQTLFSWGRTGSETQFQVTPPRMGGILPLASTRLLCSQVSCPRPAQQGASSNRLACVYVALQVSSSRPRAWGIPNYGLLIFGRRFVSKSRPPRRGHPQEWLIWFS